MEFCWRKTFRWRECRRGEQRRAREADTVLGRECARGWCRRRWSETKEDHPRAIGIGRVPGAIVRSVWIIMIGGLQNAPYR